MVNKNQSGRNSSEGSLKISVPDLSLPAGGGAIRGISETFQPHPFTGSATFSIPIYTTPSRGFQPELSLTYSSGLGNGPFGIGFSLPLSSISRRTENGVPQYRSTDSFVFDNDEILVPQRTTEVEQDNETWTVTDYRPRVEGAFNKIQHWSNTVNSYWKVTTKDNLTSVYGQSDQARIFDPDSPSKIFRWLIEESFDAKGNKIKYHYKQENSENVPPQIYEQHRTFTANKYLESIRYGNYFNQQNQEQWAFQLIFNYGEYDISEEKLKTPHCHPHKAQRSWDCRPDPFSIYRSGFEIRTYRLCRSILLFHYLEKELGPEPCLVRSTEMTYRFSSELSLITDVEVKGYRRQSDGSYQIKAMPPVHVDYTSFQPANQCFSPLRVEGDREQIALLAAPNTQLVDLYGEGLPGFLYSDSSQTLYWKPLGAGGYQAPETPAYFPNHRDLRGADLALTSLEGNGKLDLVISEPVWGGFFAGESGGGWQPYRAFTSYPLDLANPSRQFVDMEGDGLADLVVLAQDSLRYYPSLKKAGYGGPVSRRLPQERMGSFPVTDEGDEQELVTFADLLGDGLSHRIRIRSGLVEYWPNLGHGSFSKRVIMGNAPVFEGGLDRNRLFLADLSGTGPADLIYVHSDRIEIYLNQSGNRFSDPFSIHLPEPFTAMDKILFADILGNGTACLVLIKGDCSARGYYYDFSGGTKPYLLHAIENNFGASTSIRYASSVSFYLQDRLERPWLTRLPFPVQVVEKVENTDHLTGNRLVTRYRYHDGFYDHQEREFNGFGYVEQWDGESFDSDVQREVAQNVGGGTGADLLTGALYVPPTYTKQWYHTGAYFEEGAFSRQYEHQYYQRDSLAYHMPDSSLDTAIQQTETETIRQAYGALKGQLLREEVYAQDHVAGLSDHPYLVTETNYQVNLLQPKGTQRHAVFFVHPLETIEYQYERDPTDPRVQHQFFLDVDDFGNVCTSCEIYYPRRVSGGGEKELFPKQLYSEEKRLFPEQQVLKAKLHVGSYINEQAEFWLIGVPYESKSYELNGLQVEELYFHSSLIKRQVDEALAQSIRYDQSFSPNRKEARLLSWEQHYFWNLTQTTPLPLGQISERSLYHRVEHAVFPKELANRVFQERITDDILEQDGGYQLREGYWWNKGLIQHYFTENDRQFFLPREVSSDGQHMADSLQTRTVMEYDAYALTPIRIKQYLSETSWNETASLIDYYTIQPWQLTDSNDNITQVLFDPLGMVIGTTAYGITEGKRQGDEDIGSYQVQDSASFADVLDFPHKYLQKLSSFFYYDLFAWMTDRQPARSAGLERHTYESELPEGEQTAVKIHSTFTDGFGRILESKVKTDPGVVFLRDAEGVLRSQENGRAIEGMAEERWIVSGKTIYNNKGNPVLQYESFFSPLRDYEDQRKMAGVLPAPTIHHYDPLSRLIRVDTPKGFFSKVVFTAWEEFHYDVNDTVLDSVYYQSFMQDYPDQPTQQPKDEKDALEKAALFYDTPETHVLNSTGDTFLRLTNNLGQVPPDFFARLVQGMNVTSHQVWSELLEKGYLMRKERFPEAGWVSRKFQPYEKDFLLELDEKFMPYAEEIVDMLRENELRTYQKLDITGNTLLSIDPRLYTSNQKHGTAYSNFRYVWDMVHQPLSIQSADAGDRLVLNNMFGNPIHAWDQRGFHETSKFDQLQRPVSIHVSGDDGRGLVLNQMVERMVYGEEEPDAKDKNLRGQLYRLYDQAGIITQSLYDINGQLLVSDRVLLQEYRKEANWDEPESVRVEKERFTTRFSYDALKRIQSKTTPDHSVYQPEYNQAGLLDKVNVQFADGTVHSFVKEIRYNAGSLPLSIVYENQVHARFTYEPSTHHLLGIHTTRPATDLQGIGRDPHLQQIFYTYDPHGNITRARDTSYETTFFNQQVVEPLSDYTYNPIYQLTQARGRQQPANSVHPNDREKLEIYRESYTYDDAGNLTSVRHHAPSSSWSREIRIAPDSNRAVNIRRKNGVSENLPVFYDENGNMLTLEHLSRVVWNYRNNIAQVDLIDRRDEPSDRCFYVYDSKGQRVRKIMEQKISDTITEISEKIYLGTLEIKRVRRVTAEKETLILERQTLLVREENICAVMINRWLTDRDHRETDQLGRRQIRYQLTDRQGSSSVETDGEANVISYEEYLPFGGTALIAGRNEREIVLREYRYCQKERDEKTGLYYYGARYYPPWLGRWLNPDPAWTVDGLNLYAFVGNNPTTFVDPDGKAKNNRNKGNSGKITKRNAALELGKAKKISKTFLKGKVEQKKAIISELRGGRSLRMTKMRQEAVRELLERNENRAQVAMDQFAAPPGKGTPLPDQVRNAASVQGSSFTGKHTYVEQQMIVSKKSITSDKRDSTGAAMAAAMKGYSGSELSASQYSGRDDKDRRGLGEAWCHLIAHFLGGAEAASNMVAGSHGSNLVQKGIEDAVANYVKANDTALLIRVGADVRQLSDGNLTHIADQFHYQIFDSGGKNQIFHTKFSAAILRAEGLQRDMEDRTLAELNRFFGTSTKKRAA
ncbi:hypothetical protein NDK47_00890 [Brevibacillus ruminantium]|uniref:Toxin n=1 Tax=Brevibacillus ruminantium TaxID=2950604 RepID=A0ABY4WFK7_9BACL|nr:SpvB/TcaC N-terminal domain-containing protein [Brevibacillus ruminantium]USG65945.1 hypothetical protein NDK47_00890 [Brevibacillus ruminantium]